VTTGYVVFLLLNSKTTPITINSFCFICYLVETDWIAEFARKQELAEKANKLKVTNWSHVIKLV